jgi:hypothetical protein
MQPLYRMLDTFLQERVIMIALVSQLVLLYSLGHGVRSSIGAANDTMSNLSNVIQKRGTCVRLRMWGAIWVVYSLGSCLPTGL